MKKGLIIILFFYVCFSSVAQPLLREVRGAWLTTFLNIDWPVQSQSTQQQQQALINILDAYKIAGINTVFMQVRSQCDAMYQSALEPWSANLTGIQGMAPNPKWDPLAFAVEECHKRALEIHAWINPYRAIANIDNLPSFSGNHVVKKHPEWLLSSGGLRTLNPGLPEVRAYILEVIMDIVNRYDVDGIHFDDYFYPEGYVNDEATYLVYGNGFSNKADWRRENVNVLISTLYTRINDVKPWMKFGVSPSGIYRNSINPQEGSATRGLEHYSALYSDTRKWLKEGWVDYLIPQVYWSSKHSTANYNVVTEWWKNNHFNRHIYIGIGTYKLAGEESAFRNPSEIPNQIRFNRGLRPQIMGQSFYNTSSFLSNKLGIRDSVSRLYATVSLPPVMPWKSLVQPAPPPQLTTKSDVGKTYLQWKKPVSESPLTKPEYYCIYRSKSGLFKDFETTCVAIITDTVFTDVTTETNNSFFYAVSAVNRLKNESKLTLANNDTQVPVSPPSVYSLRFQKISNKEVSLVWKEQWQDSIAFFVLERSCSGDSFTLCKKIPCMTRGEEFITNEVLSCSTYFRLQAINSNGLISIGKAIFIPFVKEGNTKSEKVELPPINPAIKQKDNTDNVKTNTKVSSSVEAVKVNPPTSPKSIIAVFPYLPMVGKPIDLKMLTAAQALYYLYQNDKRVTWGKIKTGLPEVTIRLAETGNLLAGMYKLVLEAGGKRQEISFELR